MRIAAFLFCPEPPPGIHTDIPPDNHIAAASSNRLLVPSTCNLSPAPGAAMVQAS